MDINTWKRELRKGTGEIGVLYSLLHSEFCGEDLVGAVQMHGFPEVALGSIYQMMKRLKKAGFVTSRTEYANDEQPLRVFYRLTPAGGEALREAVRELNILASSILQVTNNSPLEAPDERRKRTRLAHTDAMRAKFRAKRSARPPSPSSPHTSDDLPHQ